EPGRRPHLEIELDRTGDRAFAVSPPDPEAVGALGETVVDHASFPAPGCGLVLEAGELGAVEDGVLAAVAQQCELELQTVLVVAQHGAGGEGALPACYLDVLEEQRSARAGRGIQGRSRIEDGGAARGATPDAAQ